MPRWLALLFAAAGVLLLLGVSFFISLESPGLALMCGVLAILWIGAGFAVKARFRRRSGEL